MELKAGYKQTEVGVIPEEWVALSLSQAARGIFRGASPRPIEDPIWFDDSSDVGWVRISDVTKSGRRLTETTQRLSKQGILHSRFVPNGSLIMSICATVGRPIETRLDVCIHDGFVVFDRPLTDQSYLYHVLKDLEPRWASKGQTGSQMNLNGNLIKSTIVPVPPTKSEQRAIAEALSDADALIESLDQLITKKRDLKRAAMQQLLTGQTRLTGFSGAWEDRSLFELAGGRKELFDDGDWIESEHITDDGIRLIQTGNIGLGTFVEKDERKYIFEASFFSLRCKELKQGDLLICRLAEPAGRSCVLPDIGERKVVTSVDVTIFRPPATVANRVFLSNVFSTAEWFQSVSDRSGGTTHKRISRGALGRIRIMIPEVNEQNAIATILSDMDTELAELASRLVKARHIKQGMMQELLTGRIRLV